MFYSGNDNYMQDLYFYNQNPNNTYSMNNFQNNMINGNNGMYMNSNMFPNNNQANNINSLYPSLYRILMPVVLRVIQNSNFQFFNEDVLNNMTDTIFNIVEGQIEYEDRPLNNEASSSNSNSNSNQNSNSSGNNGSSNNRSVENRLASSQNSGNNSKNNNGRCDCLLRDIIKILIIREITSKNQFQVNSINQVPLYYNQNYNMNNMNF